MILMLGDEGLKDQVTLALRSEARVNEAGIGVSVRDRVVTLTGTVGRHIEVAVADGIATLAGDVDSWAEKEAVLVHVSHTRGVRAIDDRLRVTGP